MEGQRGHDHVAPEPSGKTLSAAWSYAVVFLVAFAFYAVTCAPDVLWQDSALFVYRIWHRDLVGNLGLALGHPLYIVVGMIGGAIPVGSFAHRVSLVSAFFGAVTIANLFLLVRLWLGRTFPAVVGSISLLVSWTFWQHAAMPEVYTLLAAQILGELILLLLFVRRRDPRLLYALGALNGLTIANHVLGLFGTAVYGSYALVLLFRRELSIRQLLLYIGASVLGAGLYVWVVLQYGIETGNMARALRSALFGSGFEGSVMNTHVSLRIVFENLAFIVMNFPTPTALLLFLGVPVIWRATRYRVFSRLVFALLVLHLTFAFRYIVPDRFSFFLCFYCLAALFIAAGADRFTRRLPGRGWAAALVAFALLPILVYQFTPDLARHYVPQLADRRPRAYRDDYKYFFQPWKTGQPGAGKAVRESLPELPEGAVLYAFPTDVHPYLYVQEVEGLRPDVQIVSLTDCSRGAPQFTQARFEEWVESDLYFVTIDMPSLPPFVREEMDAYAFTPVAHVYRVERKADWTSGLR